MHTAQLRCFLTVADTLNFARAAERLHITQPAVTQQIKALEKELGVRLFHRSTHSVRLTEEGLLAVMQMAIPAIKDISWSYALLAVLPFNLLKDAIVLTVTFVVYRSVHKLLRFEK